jgi:hypothetical protein
MKAGRGFQKAYLPRVDQLAMHVDAGEFLRLVERA